jgi:hypothetical protein
MSKFLVTYHGGDMPTDPQLAEQAKAAFGAWLAQAGSAIVNPGAPLRTVTTVPADGEPVDVGGYTVIEADSVEAATAVLATHPFVARGGTLQVNEILAV